MVKTLIIMRHAKSAHGHALADHERPLNERGVEQARLAGKLLAEYRIDFLLCSTAKRTRQTWDNAILGGASAEVVEYSHAVYESWADELLARIQCFDDEYATAMVLGHQPTVSTLVCDVAKPSPLALSAGSHFLTSAFAVLTIEGRWEDIAWQTMDLVRFELPR
ncbi:MAG: histidine phosphatase family protein [Propionibacteriaceae bacterium]|nr:histidine phosphatase family protein [Propionibacteriaceae bacterium]